MLPTWCQCEKTSTLNHCPIFIYPARVVSHIQVRYGEDNEGSTETLNQEIVLEIVRGDLKVIFEPVNCRNLSVEEAGEVCPGVWRGRDVLQTTH